MIWLISLIVTFIGFYLIEHLFTIKPHTISGNGNPGLFIIIPFLPIFMTSLFLTSKIMNKMFATISNKKVKTIILSLLVIACLFLVIQMIDYKNELVAALGGTPTNPNSRIYRFGWFNQYTNNLFFNLYTFLFTHSLSCMFGIIATSKTTKNPVH